MLSEYTEVAVSIAPTPHPPSDLRVRVRLVVGCANGIHTTTLGPVLAHMVSGPDFRPATGSCCGQAAIHNHRCHSEHQEADDYHYNDGVHTGYFTSATSWDRSSNRPLDV